LLGGLRPDLGHDFITTLSGDSLRHSDYS
jgi:hypothetical protein